MPKVSQEHKDEVRRRLVSAALACLQRNGYQDITTRELLAEADLSTGTFYNYFRSKEHLYEALAEELLAGDVEALRQEIASSSTPDEGLRRFITRFLLGGRDAARALAVFRSRTSGDEALVSIRSLNSWITDAFGELVAEARQQGALHPDVDPRALVELLDIVWDGMGRRSAQGSFETGYDAVGEALVAILEHGVLAPDRLPATEASTA